MKIKKVSGTAILNGNIVDGLQDDSSTNAPSQRAVNEGINNSKSKYDLIFDGKLDTTAKDYTLNKAITDYDFLVVSAGADGEYYKSTITIPVADVHFANTEKYTYGISVNKGNAHYFVSFVFTSANTVRLWDRNNNYWDWAYVTKIYGIKL